jgi:hypothetical protein
LRIAKPSASTCLLVAAVLSAACGRSPDTGVTTSPQPSASPTSTSSPTSSPCATTWVVYSDPSRGFNFCHPAAWIDKGSPGASPTFVSDSVASPYQLSPNGIWLAIDSGLDPTGQCLKGNMQGTVINQKIVQVDGIPAGYAYVDSEFAKIVVDVPYKAGCYSFLFINGSVAGRDANASLVDSIMSTVTFSK